MMGEGGCLVDYHGCDFFPERSVQCRQAVLRAVGLAEGPGPGSRQLVAVQLPSFLNTTRVRPRAYLPACRWFDLVVVLQTDNTVLWERLEKR